MGLPAQTPRQGSARARGDRSTGMRMDRHAAPSPRKCLARPADPWSSVVSICRHPHLDPSPPPPSTWTNAPSRPPARECSRGRSARQTPPEAHPAHPLHHPPPAEVVVLEPARRHGRTCLSMAWTRPPFKMPTNRLWRTRVDGQFTRIGR